MYIEFDDEDIELEPSYSVVGCTFCGYTRYFSSEVYSECVEEFLAMKKELEQQGGGSVTIYEYNFNEDDGDDEKIIKTSII